MRRSCGLPFSGSIMLRYSQNRSTKSGASSNKRCKGDLGAASLGSEDEQTVTISQSEHEMGKMAMLLLSQVPMQIENLLMATSEHHEKRLRTDLESLVVAWSAGKPVDRILEVLDNPYKSLYEVNGESVLSDDLMSISNTVKRWVTNSWDTRTANPKFKGRTETQKQSSKEVRAIQIISNVSQLARMRNQSCTPPLEIMKTIRLFYHGVSQRLLNTEVACRNILSHEWVEAAMDNVLLLNYEAPMEFDVSPDIEIFVKDNLEWWWNIKWQRTAADGTKVMSDLIHTVTGERVPVPRWLLKEPIANMANWPFMRTYNLQQIVLSRQEMDTTLTQKWEEARIKSIGDNMSYLRRPPADEDKKIFFGPKGKRTPHFAVPIQMYVGTSSTADCQKIVDHVLSLSKCRKQIIVGDYQTFKNLYWIKLRDPVANNDWVPFAGEWHQMAHMMDAIVIKHWRHIYEPIAHYLNIKGLQLKLIMKETMIRYRWTMVIANAGLIWLRTIFTEEEISDPMALMKACEKNTPVWNFLTFIFYFVNSVWACKTATQCSDSELMDWVWKYSLLLYGDTNKTQYKKYVLELGLLVFDAEPNVKAVMDNYRTYTESGKPCTGAAYDYMVEKVINLNLSTAWH